MKLPLRFTLHIEVGVDRPGEQEPPTDLQAGAVLEASRHEDEPELGLTPRRPVP